MNRTSFALLLLLAGCPMSSGSMAGTSPVPGPNGTITIPNVFDMSKERAIAELRRAGFQGSISEDNSLCDSVVEGRVIEIGQVCYQHPPAGRVQGARLPISVRVQTENPWHGNAGKPNEWRLMPTIAGMTVEQARAEMKRVGFSREDRVYVSWIDEPGCKPLTVCRTYPTAMQRAGVNSDKVVFAGRDPNAKPRRDESRSPEPDPAKLMDPAKHTDPAKPRDPAKLDSALQPEPFF